MFSLFFEKSKLEQEKDFIHGATIFFERLTKYGLFVTREEYYDIRSDMSIESINHELVGMTSV